MKDNKLVLSVLSVIVVLGIVYFSTQPQYIDTYQEEEVVTADTNSVEEPELTAYPFGIFSDDSLIIESGRIKRNETLYSILSAKTVSMVDIHEVAKRSKKVFNFRNLSIRNPYHVVRKADSTHKPMYFIYETSMRDYVKVALDDSIFAVTGTKPSEYKEHIAAGVVESSLYASLMEQDLDPQLAYQIAEVFAWQVDFYRVQKGDSYQVILEREFIDEKPTGDAIIKAARFNQSGDTYYAFRFEDNGRARYFDEHGNSLQKTFLKAPLKYSRVSSRYTKRRFHPVLKTYKAHLGTDYVAPKGTPVYAVADGIIEKAGYGKNNGNFVKIRHNSIFESGYLHFSKLAAGIKTGKRVKQGQVIGYVGDTGLASGTHLCYRFWKNGTQVDPYKQYNPPAQPIETELMVEYLTFMNHLKVRLDSISPESFSNNDMLAVK
ncbi:peptidase M23 [bacterium]|nr:MAG: peptidase M23 [bacterium]